MDILNSTIKSTLKKYKPQIIGVTGAVGRTLAIGALKSVLGNHSIGVMPQGDMYAMKVALLGGSGNMGGFILIVKAWLRNLVGGQCPEKIILEYPLVNPADLKARLSLAKPDILVVTDLVDKTGSVAGREEVTRNAENIIGSVNPKGLVVLNIDDPELISMKAKARIMTFGFGDSADLKIVNFEDRAETGKPTGISFKLEYMGSFVPVRMEGVSGKLPAYAAASAAAVGIAGGMNLVKISEAVSVEAEKLLIER